MRLEPNNRAKAGALLVAANLLWVFLTIFLIKYSTGVLGWAGYGAAIHIITIRSMVQLIDFDLSQGIKHALMSHANSDEKTFWISFRVGLYLNIILGVLGAIILGFGWRFIAGALDPDFVAIYELMFGLMAVQFFTDSISSSFLNPFYAKEKFGVFVQANAIQPCVVVVINAALVFWLRSPVALCLGMLIDSSLGLVLRFIAFLRIFGKEHIWPKFEAGVAKSILLVGIRSYPGNISGRIAGTVDKVIIGVLSQEALGIYNIVTKIPQVLMQVFGSATGLAMPEMIRTSQNEPEKYSELLKRNVGFLTVFYSVVILLPSAFSGVILKAWLHKDVPGFAEMCILMSVYYTLEMNLGTITASFYAFKKAHLLFPFALWNALVTVFCTGPIAKKFGLVGVAWMNMFIDVLQIIPIHWLLTRQVVKGDSMWWYAQRMAVPVAVTALFSAVIAYALRGVPFGIWAFFWTALTPVAMGTVLLLLVRSGKLLLPNSIKAPLRSRPFLVKLFGGQLAESA